MTRLVKLGLEMGTSPNLIDTKGYTPLHYAASASNSEAMQLLVEYGANVNSTSNSGHTALSLAAANGSVEVMKLLLAAGARPFEIHSGWSDNPFAHDVHVASAQRLSLAVIVSMICSDCGAFKSHYIVRIFPFLILNSD
jgi:ankyrin repeat protein